LFLLAEREIIILSFSLFMTTKSNELLFGK